MKASFGEYDQIASARDPKIGSIAKKIDDILKGENAAFIDMSDVFVEEEMTSRIFMESIPSGTKRIQVKGYHVCKEGRYVFCVCIDDQGMELTRLEGSGTISYADVFICETAVVTNLNTFDYVFWKPSRSSVALR